MYLVFLRKSDSSHPIQHKKRNHTNQQPSEKSENGKQHLERLGFISLLYKVMRKGVSCVTQPKLVIFAYYLGQQLYHHSLVLGQYRLVVLVFEERFERNRNFDKGSFFIGSKLYITHQWPT